MTALILGIPSKGRLMEASEALFAKAGFGLTRGGSDRLYRGRLKGVPDVDVAFLSASEIAGALKDGKIDLGVTGEDLLRETLKPDDERVDILQRLGFGLANVVVAVPQSWLDVARMSDLDEVSEGFYERHGRRLRVATKYLNLTRRFFAMKGVTGYRIVESLGATEGAPAAGTAEAIIDITTTGSTLAANHLKILDDGVILESQAVLAAQARLKGDQRVAILRAGLSQAVVAA
ncbi:MAG: ATP phosphoribosyltransferase [Alphaproteobacteria bacterium]|nr:MAG: ATP phosphoribosyltransferase [Alphaproteobacteria bacterium]